MFEIQGFVEVIVGEIAAKSPYETWGPPDGSGVCRLGWPAAQTARGTSRAARGASDIIRCHTVLSAYYATPCHAMPCHAMPCHAIPYHATPRHATPCHAMPCHRKRDETRQDETRRDETRRGQARPGQARPGQARPCHAMT